MKYRADDLMVNGLRVYQDPDGYCFTTDACILAEFCNAKKSTRALDLGSGSGIIGILLVGKYMAKSCVMVELQPALAQMSEASVQLNGLSDRISVINIPMQECAQHLPLHSFDLVVCNPPYTRPNSGETNLREDIAICRHEKAVTLKEVVQTAASMVRYGGRVCLVHQAERLAEIVQLMYSFKLTPKRLRLVEGKAGLNPTLCLIEASYGGAHGLRVARNLVLYDQYGNETQELKNIYARQEESK